MHSCTLLFGCSRDIWQFSGLYVFNDLISHSTFGVYIWCVHVNYCLLVIFLAELVWSQGFWTLCNRLDCFNVWPWFLLSSKIGQSFKLEIFPLSLRTFLSWNDSLLDVIWNYRAVKRILGILNFLLKVTFTDIVFMLNKYFFAMIVI